MKENIYVNISDLPSNIQKLLLEDEDCRFGTEGTLIMIQPFEGSSPDFEGEIPAEENKENYIEVDFNYGVYYYYKKGKYPVDEWVIEKGYKELTVRV